MALLAESTNITTKSCKEIDYGFIMLCKVGFDFTRIGTMMTKEIISRTIQIIMMISQTSISPVLDFQAPMTKKILATNNMSDQNCGPPKPIVAR